MLVSEMIRGIGAQRTIGRLEEYDDIDCACEVRYVLDDPIPE